jgi:hypothetical protein
VAPQRVADAVYPKHHFLRLITALYASFHGMACAARMRMAHATADMLLTPKRLIEGLRWRADALYGRLPYPVRVWILERQARARARLGLSFSVEHDRLARSYRKAWELLLGEDPTAASGDFLEFGVYYGTSLACMHQALGELGLDRVRMFGFDSFEGMPESADREPASPWLPGQYRSSLGMTRSYLKKRGVPPDRVVLEKGWFSDTLTPEFRERNGIRRASFLMVDCDLYSSAREALDFAGPLLGRRTVIYFDDWHAAGMAEKGEGERRAFEEFLAANPDLSARELEGLEYKDTRHPKMFMVSRTSAAR